MAKYIYIGVNGTAKKIKKAYIGVNGVAKKIKKAYVGVNGVARLCFSRATIHTTQTFNVNGGDSARSGKIVTVTKYLTLDHIPIGEQVYFDWDVNNIKKELRDVHVIVDHDNVVKVTIEIKSTNTVPFIYLYDLDIHVHYNYEE